MIDLLYEIYYTPITIIRYSIIPFASTAARKLSMLLSSNKQLLDHGKKYLLSGRTLSRYVEVYSFRLSSVDLSRMYVENLTQL